MIKKLVFTAALLAPGLAYGGNPSVDLTVQINPASPPPNGIACDIGPSYIGSIPAAATQAGFTHCAANYDITQTQSFTDSAGTHQWSNLSTWFVCNRTLSNPYLWYFVGSVGCDTNHQNITTDGGVQVLALSYRLTDAQAGQWNNQIQNEVNGSPNPLPEQFYRGNSHEAKCHDGQLQRVLPIF